MDKKIKEAVEAALNNKSDSLNIISYRIDGKSISFYILLPERTRTVTDPEEIITIKFRIGDKEISRSTIPHRSCGESPSELQKRNMAVSRFGHELSNQLVKCGACENW